MTQPDDNDKIPAKLYKYVAPERVDILKNGNIRFTQHSGLNDRFDLRPIIKQMISNQNLEEKNKAGVSEGAKENMAQAFAHEDILNEYGVSDQYERYPLTFEVKYLIRLLYHRNHLPKMLEEFQEAMPEYVTQRNQSDAVEFRDFISQHYGVLSLTEDPTNDSMWSRYAAENKGFVIEFDTRTPIFIKPRLRHISKLNKVVYKKREPIPQLIDTEDPTSIFPNLFYIKSQEWEPEKEWRSTAYLLNPDKLIRVPDHDPICLYNFVAKSVTGVIFGIWMEQKDIDEVLKVLDQPRYKHVLRSQVQESDNDYSVVIKPYKACE